MTDRPSQNSPDYPLGKGSSVVLTQQPSLFPLRVGTPYPTLVNGADIAFSCEAQSGGTYFCKRDKDGRHIRAAEWFFTHVARYLGIVTPECAILEDGNAQDTVFGSLQVIGEVAGFEAHQFLTTPSLGELGQPSEWPGAYLSGLYVIDLFIGNIDRSLKNFFVLQEGSNRRLCAYDFASANLAGLATRQFPVATCHTIQVGRFLRFRHSFFDRAANDMIDRIAAIPSEVIASFLKQMPGDWMSLKQREGICELWSARRFGGRLMALRTGIADGSLL